MALALTLLSLFTLAGLALATVSGWALSHGAGASVARHIAIAVPAVLFSLFTQSMVLFFFIGTGKMLKQAAAARADEAGRAYILAKVREMKTRTSSLATFAPLSALLAGLLGGAVHTGKLPAWPHLASSVLALVLHAAAFFREVVAMAETNKLMDEAATLVPPASVTASFLDAPPTPPTRDRSAR
jgi:Na+/H+ antiporter NhaC